MRTIAILVPLLAAGCGTYQVQRSALVPHPAPQMHPGTPLESVAEVGLGASSVGHLREPGVGNPDMSVEIPGTQLHGDARFRINDTLAIGVLYQNGVDATAHKPKGNLQPDVDEGNVQGYGLSAEVAIPTQNPNFKVGLAFDVMTWSVPWVEWRTCVDNCIPGDGFTYVSSGTDSVSTVGVAVTPSFRAGNVTWFGGLTARQHPTIEQKGTENEGDLFEGGDVENGPFNLTISAGAEIDLGPVKGSVILYQTVTQDPVKYGPSMAALITVPIGRRSKAPAQAPAAPPPPGAPSPSPLPNEMPPLGGPGAGW